MNSKEIELWTIPLEADPTVICRFERTLSPKELERANRFRFKKLQDAYKVGRGALRHLLGGRLGLAPEKVSITESDLGKPRTQGIQFNISHSGAYAMIGISPHTEIGVDIERHRPLPDLIDIAKRYFCPEELGQLQALPPELQEPAFFLCWTRKEAYIKAIGEGLHAPLDRFQVTLTPGAPVRFVHVDHDPEEATRWSLHSLDAPEQYAAAIAYRDQRHTIRQHPILSAASLKQLTGG